MREGAVYDSSRGFNPKKLAIDLESQELLGDLSNINGSDGVQMQQSAPVATDIPDNSAVKKSPAMGTPEMMAASMAVQLVDERMAAPYKEMAVKQAGEENRRAKQENALVNLQNISKMYGNL